MALAPAGPVIPDLQVGHKASCTQAVCDAINALVQKFRIVNFTKEFGRELDFVKNVPEVENELFLIQKSLRRPLTVMQ